MGTPPRLNVLALPSRTTLLFILILVVIYAPLLWAWGVGTPVCMPFLLAAMVVLPLRSFLRQPQQVVEKEHLEDARSEYPLLVERVRTLAREPAQITPPHVFISPDPFAGAFARGSFTRTLLGFAANTAAALTRWLESKDESAQRRAHALILHELAHFCHHDVWLAMLSRSILAVAVVLLSVAFLVHLLTPLLYYRMLTFFLYPGSPFADVLRALMPNDPVVEQFLDSQIILTPTQWGYYIVTIFASFVPMIVGSAALWLVYWRALLRTRELYADARVAQWQGASGPLWEMLWIETMLQSLQPQARGWRHRLRRGRNALQFSGGRVGKRVRTWFAVHPADERRERCFDAPHEIYGDSWSIGLAAGAAALLLNLNLASLFLSQSVRGPNSVPPFALGFVVITVSLLPFLCQHRGTLRGLVWKIAGIVALFTLVNLIPLYLGGIIIGGAVWLDPNLLQGALEASVRGELPPEFGSAWSAFFIEQFLVRPALLFTFFMPLFLVGYVLGALWLVRRMLRWYGAPLLARNSSALFWYVIGVMTLVLVFVILPWVDELTVPTAHDPLTFETLTPMLVVGAFGLLNAALFIVLNGQYGNRCPRCQGKIAGDCFLGKRCVCGVLLNPWLLDSAPVPRDGSERTTHGFADEQSQEVYEKSDSAKDGEKRDEHRGEHDE